MYSIETDEQNENAKRKTEWTKRNKWLYMLAEYEKRKKKREKRANEKKLIEISLLIFQLLTSCLL